MNSADARRAEAQPMRPEMSSVAEIGDQGKMQGVGSGGGLADYDLRHQRWGHTMERQWAMSGPMADGREKVQGCLTPAPTVGKTVLLSNNTVWIFDEVELPGPRDLYFATIRRLPANNTMRNAPSNEL